MSTLEADAGGVGGHGGKKQPVKRRKRKGANPFTVGSSFTIVSFANSSAISSPTTIACAGTYCRRAPGLPSFLSNVALSLMLRTIPYTASTS